MNVVQLLQQLSFLLYFPEKLETELIKLKINQPKMQVKNKNSNKLSQSTTN